MLQHDLFVETEFGSHFFDHFGVGLEMELHVVTVCLFGVVRVGEGFATDPVDLLQLGTVRFQLFGNARDDGLDAFFFGLEVEDVNSFVFAFHNAILDLSRIRE
jgi:hypothetical protein